MDEKSIFFLALGGFVGLALGVVLGSLCSAGLDWFGWAVVGPMIGAFAAVTVVSGFYLRQKSAGALANR